MTLCYHTYLRWVNNVAVCAVCGEAFHDIIYSSHLVGTFPRESAQKFIITVASTILVNSPIRSMRLDEYF